MIKIIINADDFCYSKIFNEKILYLLEREFIKSTTVMIDWLTKEQENQIKRLININKKGKISIGLHVVFNLNKSLPEQVEKQFRKFKKIFGFNPSHLDYHKYVGNLECVKTIINFGEKHNLPVRHMEIQPKTKHTTHKIFSTVPLNLQKVINFLNKLKEGETCEVLCHPGEYDPNCNSSLNKKRKYDYQNIIKLQFYLKNHPNIKNINYNEL